jgi:hypothetical protein
MKARVLACAVLAWPLLMARAQAGGVDFAPDETADAGPSYFGLATDSSGGAVADAKVTVNVAKLNSTVVQRADSQGHFFIQGFDKSVSPSDVVITCSKDGFKDATATKTPGSDPTAPVQVVCVLEKKS